MSSNPEDVLKDIFEIYHRLFDHNAAVKGESNFFFNNFKDGDDLPIVPSTSGETKPQPTRLETLLRTCQIASEAGDVDFEKTIRQSDIDKVSVKLDAASAMMEKIVERGRCNAGVGPYSEYMEKSKQEQRKDLQQFSADMKRKMQRVDEEYREKVEDLKQHFDGLVSQRTT